LGLFHLDRATGTGKIKKLRSTKTIFGGGAQGRAEIKLSIQLLIVSHFVKSSH
jgi:hypothetical protein